MKIKSNKVDFYKTKYSKYLLIDLIRLESLEKYINSDNSHYLSYFDITLITCGEGQFCLDAKKYGLEKGLVIFSSPGHLNDLSKSVLGISAKKYITERILTEAKKFLVLSDSPVSEIAAELGYIDTSYFIRRFKNETGMTPFSFRKEQNL